MVMEFMEIYHRFRKRRMNAQVQLEDSSFGKKPKTGESQDHSSSNIIEGFMKKIKSKQQAMKIDEVSNLKSSYSKPISAKEEPYFLRRQSSVKRRQPVIEIPAKISPEKAERKSETFKSDDDKLSTSIDIIVEDFRGNFNSPNNTLTRDAKGLNKNNYVKKMVAAFEEKYGNQSTTPFTSPVKSKIQIPSRCAKSINDPCVKSSASKSVRRVPVFPHIHSEEIAKSIERPKKEEEKAAKSMERSKKEESKKNGAVIEEEIRSLNSTLETIAINTESESKNEPKIDRYWSDVTMQNRQLSNVDSRATKSCLEPIIIGALLKKPVKVENTQIDWIPVPSQRLPRKKSLKKLISRITRRKKLLKDGASLFDNFDACNSSLFNDTINHDSQMQDSRNEEMNLTMSNMDTSSCRPPSPRSLKRKPKEMCSLHRSDSKKSRSNVPLVDIYENNNYIESKENIPKGSNAVKVILHEVPREKLDNSLAPSYLKIMRSTSNISDTVNQETVSVKTKSEMDISTFEKSVSENNDNCHLMNSSGVSTFKQSPKNSDSESKEYVRMVKRHSLSPKLATPQSEDKPMYASSNKMSTFMQSPKSSKLNLLPNLRKKTLFPATRPKSDALDEVKSYYRRYDSVDRDIRNFIHPDSNQIYGNDIVDTLHKMKLQNLPDEVVTDLNHRPRSAFIRREVNSRSYDTFENYAKIIRDRYLNSENKRKENANVERQRCLQAEECLEKRRNIEIHRQFMYDELPTHVKTRSREVLQQEIETQHKRRSVFFDERMKNANFDIFVKPEMNSPITGWAQESTYQVPRIRPLATPVSPDHLRSRKDVSVNAPASPLTRSPLSPKPLTENLENRSQLHTYQLRCTICPNQLCVMRS